MSNSDLLALLHSGQKISRFDPTSRYYASEVVLYESSDTSVAYIRRRFLPDPGRMREVGTRTVQQGDRLDLIADAVLANPEQWWRLADGNRILKATELEAFGVDIRIAVPEVN